MVAMAVAEAQTAVPSVAGDDDQNAGLDQPGPAQGEPAADGQQVAGDAVPAPPDAPADGSHWLGGLPGARDDQVSPLGSTTDVPSSLASEFSLLYSIVQADAGDVQNGQGDQGAGVGLQADDGRQPDEPGSAAGQ